MKILVLENDSEMSYDYQAKSIEFVRGIWGSDSKIEYLFNLQSRELEEVTEKLSKCDAIYVNSNIVNKSQYTAILLLIRDAENVKMIFFADWYFDLEKKLTSSTTTQAIKDNTIRRLLNDYLRDGKRKFRIVTDSFKTKIYELTAPPIYDQTLDEYYIQIKQLF